jgi:hypothetical protein
MIYEIKMEKYSLTEAALNGRCRCPSQTDTEIQRRFWAGAPPRYVTKKYFRICNMKRS